MQTTTVPVFDPAKLHRHTNGDPGMQVEVLALFATEVERLMRQVEDAPDGQVRRDRLRALMASARNIGAALLAQQARSMEVKIAGENPDLTPLREVVDETLAYVQRTGV